MDNFLNLDDISMLPIQAEHLHYARINKQERLTVTQILKIHEGNCV